MAAHAGRLHPGSFPQCPKQIWLPGIHIFWASLPKGLPSRLKKHDMLNSSSPPRCACCARKYDLSVTCTEKHRRGGEGFWCRGNRGIWSNAVLRALEQMTNIGHKPPRVGLAMAMVNTAKPRFFWPPLRDWIWHEELCASSCCPYSALAPKDKQDVSNLLSGSSPGCSVSGMPENTRDGKV